MRACCGLLAVSVVLLVGCSGAQTRAVAEVAPAAAEEIPAVASNGEKLMELMGTSWKVTAYHDGKSGVVPVLDGTTLSLSFAAGSASGSAGCNRYNASVTVDGSRLAFGRAASTRMACGGVAGMMEQEAAYLAAFETAVAFRVSGDRIELHRQDGSVAVEASRE